jgi:hypothetical protein
MLGTIILNDLGCHALVPELQEALRHVKRETADKMEALRESWLERDRETLRAIGSFQSSAESRLVALESGTEERYCTHGQHLSTRPRLADCVSSSSPEEQMFAGLPVCGWKWTRR